MVEFINSIPLWFRISLVAIVTLFACLSITNLYGVFEYKKAHTVTVNQSEKRRKNKNSINQVQRRLKGYSDLTEKFAFLLFTEAQRNEHLYYITRLDIRDETLNRRLTPEELRGKHIFILLLSCIGIPLIIVNRIFIFLPIFGIVDFIGYTKIFKGRIIDEDIIIDDYFLNLYLLIYSKLRQGSRARLSGVVQNYYELLKEENNDDRVNEVMIRLSKHILDLLSVEEDHRAIPKLKESYRSATIVNFCNVAQQSLNGVENDDNLLSFKMQLTDRKLKTMEKRQKRILASGNRAIMLIWAILFYFVAVGWYSKLPTGFF